ncbi:MAG: alpha/beta fold hydrolase [Pseudomonadota bacterium]
MTTTGVITSSVCPSPPWRTTCLLLFLLACSWTTQAITPRDILAQPDIDNVMISPTGEYLVVTKYIDDDNWFFLYKMPERKEVYRSNLGSRRAIVSMYWGSDYYLVAEIARRAFRDAKGLTGEIMAMDVKKGKVNRHFRSCCVVVHTLPDDQNHILVRGSPDQFGEVWKTNLKTGSERRVARSFYPYGGFVADREGKVIFTIGQNQRNGTEVHRKRGRDWDLVTAHEQGTPGWEPIAAGPKPNTYLTIDSRGGPTNGLGLYDEETGDHQMLLRLKNVDVGAIYRDLNYQVYAVRSDMHFPAIHYLSNKHPLARIRQGLQQTFPEDTITFTSQTKDNSQVIALVQGDRNPGQFVLVDLKRKSVETLFTAYPGLENANLAPMNPVEIKTRDGATIYGYLTVSPVAPRPGPTVVLLHGGPHGVRDFWGYNPEVQLLAMLGVHVLQVNYRGSGGFGLDFMTVGYQKWGTLMQDDVTDATHWAIENGDADPNKICAYGGSYGAYAALMGTAREPDLYTCAVGIAGVYDLTIMDKLGDIPEDNAGRAFVAKAIGTDPEDLMARSPSHLADRIKADVMLIHGAVDRRAPIAHARRMRQALNKAGNSPEWMTDGKQGHGFAGLRAQLELYEAIFSFLGDQLELPVDHFSWDSELPEG